MLVSVLSFCILCVHVCVLSVCLCMGGGALAHSSMYFNDWEREREGRKRERWGREREKGEKERERERERWGRDGERERVCIQSAVTCHRKTVGTV